MQAQQESRVVLRSVEQAVRTVIRVVAKLARAVPGAQPYRPVRGRA